MKEEKKKAFIAHKANGFLLTFPNGNSLSTLWGSGTYSDNYDLILGEITTEKIIKSYTEPIEAGSNTVEVMPHCSDLVKKLLDATFPDEENGSVFGHLTFEKWLKMVNILNENN